MIEEPQKIKFIMHQLQLFELPQPQDKIVVQKKRQMVDNNSKTINDTDELKKTHHTHPRYKDTVENAEKYTQQLSKLSFDRLGRNLDIIQEQMQIAFKEKKYATYEFLYEWEIITINARLLKLDREEKQSRRKIKKGK